MITDAKAFRPDYVPREMIHRQGQVEHLASILQPIQHEMPTDNVMLFGPSGTGKTTLARYVTDKLQRQTLDVDIGYVSCIQDSTANAAMYRLLRKGGVGTSLRMEGSGSARYLEELREHEGQFVAIIDEVDVLADRRLLHSLSDIKDVAVIMICVDEDTLFADLDQRIESRLRSAKKITLDRYTHDEMVDILWSRIEAGVRSTAIASEAVDEIADLAAGDARHGITLLRQAAQTSTERDEKITPTMVREVAEEAKDEIGERRAANLGTHQRILYDIIQEAGEIGAEELKREYRERASDPKSQSTRYRYLESMERYDLIGSEGTGRGAQYRLF